jgi:hypothetical protein
MPRSRQNLAPLSMNAQWSPAYAYMRQRAATELSEASSQMGSIRSDRLFHCTSSHARAELDHQHLVIRAIEMNMFVQRVDQAGAMLSKKRQNRV